MPTVGLSRDKLFEALGKTFTDEEFDELCFEFGIELDEITSERQMKSKESGKDQAEMSEEVIYKIDVPANRYDLLCLEGLSRALLIFMEKIKHPMYLAEKPAKMEQIVVEKETAEVRPVIIAAILRDVAFDATNYQSFIDLQEKLHQNICRKRTLVSIGTHDYDTVQGPFRYAALPPDQIKFAPLNQEKVMNAAELMTFYETDSHLRKYLPIIRDKPRYPVVLDRNGVVLSLPPIINSNHSKITLATKNVFIECTATDLTKAKVVLNTIVAMFSQYCKKPFHAELVEVVSPSGQKEVYPDLTYHDMEASVDYINKAVGIKIEPERISKLLEKMGLDARLSDSKDKVFVRVPPTRSDILHACDIMEDVAIGYGFNNLRHTIPATNTVAQPFPLNKLSDLLRRELAYAGFTEVLTFALCSMDESSKFLNRPKEVERLVKISNPKTTEFEVARSSLIPGLLKTAANNKGMSLPLKLFEISDIVLKDPSRDVGARNSRSLSALYLNKTSGFEVIHGLLDRIMEILDVKQDTQKNGKGYRIEACEDDTFFPGRCARIICCGKQIGIMGILHPTVLEKFELTNPCSLLEMDVEPFL